MSCEESVDIQFKRWQRKLNKSIHACFRKVRLKEKEPSKIYILMNEKQGLLKKKTKSDADLEKIEEINLAIPEQCEDKEFEKHTKALGDLENESGAPNNTNIWKKMKKSYPNKSKPLPTGIILY